MKSKLILVEGIPGSGKSTTAQFVSGWLSTMGLQTYLYQEGQSSHPADPDGMAYLENAAYTALLQEHADLRYTIQDHTAAQYGGYVVNYRRMDEAEKLPDALYETLQAKDIYASASPELYMQITQGMWQSFADQATIEEGVYIFECCFLQNPFTVLLGQHNLSPEAVKQHVQTIGESIAPLFPLAVYLDAGSARQVLQKAIDSRPQEWIDFVTDYITGQGYGKAHNLQGNEGVFQFYELMQNWMAESLEALEIPMMRAPVVGGGLGCGAPTD